MKFLRFPLALLLLLAPVAHAQPVPTPTSAIINNATAIVGGSTGECLTRSAAGTATFAACSSGSVTTLSFGTTGLTPSSATAGAIVAAGTLVAPNGGTGFASYAVGDILYANSTTTLAKLADVATGNVLLSGGITTAPAWGKVALASAVSGTLAAGNGGTGVANTGTITLAASVTTTGAGAPTLAFPASTATYTFPTVTASLAPLASPAFTTPSLGVATGTSLALNGATISTNALAITGTVNVSSTLTAGTLVATGGITTVDGRFQQASGPIIDLRTANTGKIFQTDNTTLAAWQAGTLTTLSPAGTTAGAWKLGNVVSGAVVLDTTRSVFLDIGGTVYKLMVAQ